MLHYKEVLQMKASKQKKPKSHFKSNFKYSVSGTYDTMLCSGVSTSGSFIDTDYSHFSFAIFSVSPLEFADTLEKVIEGALCNTRYFKQDDVQIKTTDCCDSIRITRDCRTIAITRGNLKVLFAADVSALIGLPDAIRKEYQKYEELELKEQKLLDGKYEDKISKVLL